MPEHHESGPAFKVEVRSTGRPIPMGDTIVAGEWIELPLIQVAHHALGYDWRGRLAQGASPARGDPYDQITGTHNFMSAVALAASALSNFPWSGLEARLVEYTRKIDWSLDRVEELPFETELDVSMNRAAAKAEKRKAEGKNEEHK